MRDERERERVVYGTKKLFSKIIPILFIILLIFSSFNIKSAYAENQTIHTSNLYHIYDCGTVHITSQSGKLLYCVVPFGFAPDPGETVSFSNKNITTSTYGNDQKLAKILYYGYGGGGNILTDYSDSEAEAITHFALSKVWVHDMQAIGSNLKNYWNCTSFSNSSFINDQGINKVNDFLSRINSLPNVSGTLHISKNYEAGVSADQDLLWGEFSCSGKIQIIKKSDRPDKVSEYPITGAEFSLYTDSSCTTIAKDIHNEPVKFTITSSGKSNIVEVLEGTYYLKETKVPENYYANTEVIKIEVTNEAFEKLEIINELMPGLGRVQKKYS